MDYSSGKAASRLLFLSYSGLHASKDFENIKFGINILDYPTESQESCQSRDF